MLLLLIEANEYCICQVVENRFFYAIVYLVDITPWANETCQWYDCDMMYLSNISYEKYTQVQVDYFDWRFLVPYVLLVLPIILLTVLIRAHALEKTIEYKYVIDFKLILSDELLLAYEKTEIYSVDKQDGRLPDASREHGV